MSPSRFDLASVQEALRDPPSLALSPDAPAAVAAILRDGRSDVELLFIERAEREGDPWSGHLAFPGGKREPGDASLLETAIRETEEEVAIRLAPASCLAQLDVVEARSTSYRVTQFAFALDGGPEAKTSAEVHATLWVPLSRLARLEGAGTVKFVRGGREIDLPCLHLGARVLWGMTYRMTMQLLRKLGVAVDA